MRRGLVVVVLATLAGGGFGNALADGARVREHHRPLPMVVSPGPVDVNAVPAGARASSRAIKADEARLWRLYRRGEYARLDRLLSLYRASGVAVPRELLHWLAVARVNRARKRAEGSRDWFALVDVAGRHPEAFGCRFPEHEAWLARAWARLGYAERAGAHYRRLLTRCPPSGPALDNLIRRAADDLPADALLSLARTLRRSKPPEADLVEFEGLTKALPRARDEKTRQRLESRARALAFQGELGPGPVFDMGMALRRAGMRAAAARWFVRYLEMDADKPAARVFTARWAIGHRLRATHLLPAPPAGSHREEKALQDALSQEFFAAYKSGDYRGARMLANALKKRRALTTDERLVEAWNLYHLGMRDEARQAFARLRRETGDPRAAKGEQVAARGIASANGSAEDAWLYAHKQFLAARAAGVGGSLANLERPSVALGGSLRFRKGAHPLERMDVLEWPFLDLTTTGFGAHRLTLSATRVQVRSPAHRTSVPFERVSLPGALAGAVSATGVRWSLDYERPGRNRPHARLALFPGWEVGARKWGGEFGLALERDDWHGDATAFYRPFKANALAYAGRRDAAGRPWGRIMRGGVELSAWRRLTDRWGLSLAARAERLEGRQILANTHLALGASLSRALDWWANDFMSTGPYLRYEHYGHNALPFTIGHGGYFSPQQQIQIGLSWDWLSPEAARWSVRAHADIGWQNARSDATRLFPLSPDPAIYPGSTANGLNYNLEAILARALTPSWFVHGGVILRGSPPSYRDAGLMLALEWHFGARAAVFSDDLKIRRLEETYR
ncbi:MAG: hypothetical protein D6790_01285 [Caldilineae bacterium]|nr:MAG: hypothetical protein D6790_01285 [Caldilineae bacterium]